MKRLSPIAAAAAAVMVMALFLGCTKPGSTSKGSTGPITLRVTWIGGGQDKDLLDKCLVKYTAETGIKVDPVFIPGSWAEYFTKIQTMIAGGEQFDVCNVAIEGFEMLVQTGMAAPIDTWIANNKAEWDAVVNDISPNVMAFMNFGGKQYGAPNEWNNVVTHINLNLLREAGLPMPPPNWTKEQFLEYAQKLTKKRPDGTTQYGCFVPNYYFGFEAWLYNNNAAYMTGDFKKSRLLEPNTVEMFQFMYDLVYKYQVAPIPEPGMDTAQLLEDGNIAMHFAGRWPTTKYYADNFREVGVQYVPNFKTNVPIWGGTGVFTLKSSKHPNEAASLALYLASAPFIEEFMQYGAIPVLNSVAAKLVPSLGVPQNAGIYIESAAMAKAVQSPAQYAECAQLVERVITEILINKQDIETTLRTADVELNDILSDN
ncbi:MAG: sugar ABC transporter substrate-binding protein [Treponema sp.]|jgi:ABC-type glycerol-3-phosphate transport system substrate-binding protein|nr:sugar ABC transporter substrate-binding protein [Treponema sp.]